MSGPGTILAVTLAIQAMVAMAVLTLPVMAPAVAAVLGISPAYLGLYVAIAYLGALVASAGSGAAVTRWGAVRVSQGALLLCAAGALACTLPSLPAMAFGALLVGLGYGPVTPASSHLLARSTPAHRMSLVFSIKQTGVPLGSALAGALVPTLQIAWGWQGALVAIAGASLLCAALAQPMRRALDADRHADAPMRLAGLAHPIRLVLGHPTLRMLAGCSFVFSIVQLSLTAYLVTHLTESLGYGLVAAGLVLTASQFGGVAGRVFWGFVSDRWLGARRMLMVLALMMSVSALVTALLPPATPHGLLVGVLVVFGASGIGWNGVYLAEVARQAPPGTASVATGGTLAITFLGVVIGPPLFGGISGLFGSYRAGYAAVALPAAVCGLVLLRSRFGAAPSR